VPKPLLFALDEKKKHNVLFNFDPSLNRWYIDFEEIKTEATEKKKPKRSGKKAGKNRDKAKRADKKK
jgi:hypothetical protein